MRMCATSLHAKARAPLQREQELSVRVEGGAPPKLGGRRAEASEGTCAHISSDSRTTQNAHRGVQQSDHNRAIGGEGEWQSILIRAPNRVRMCCFVRAA